MPFTKRERCILGATAVLSLGAPIGGALWVGARTDALAAKLGSAAGVDAKIGGVDADLTGTVRLSDVRFGELVSAESIEASTSLESLLDGTFGADEIRVAGPHLTIDVDATGDSDLARMARRLAGHRSGGGSGKSRVRRVVVSSGSLTAHIANVGELTADDVELVPDEHGVRVITGRVRVHAMARNVGVDVTFGRAAAELALPQARLGRILAVAGTGTVNLGDHAVPLRDVAAGRLSATGALEAHAAMDDGGVPRPISAEVTHAALTVKGDRVPLRAVGALAPHGLDLDTARGTGTLTVRKGDKGTHLEVNGAIDGARFDHPAVAATPIEINAKVRGAIDVASDAIVVSDATLVVGAAQWNVNGWMRRGQPASGQVDVQLLPASCNDLLASLPEEMRGPLDGMQMDGELGGKAHLSIDLAAPVGDGVELTTSFDGNCHVSIEPPAADVTSLAGVTEHAYPDGTSARVGRGAPGWVDYHRLPSYLPQAFVAAEDAAFWDHHGFDLHQIAKSLEIDLRERRIARGGSTISQQLVKNVFLSQRRSADRKLQEAILTWRLEEKLDKKTILERYLNVIELGPRVFGIGAASKHWFGVSPGSLNLHQAAFLAAITAEPNSMSRRVRRAGALDPDSSQRIDVVLRAMNLDGFISSDTMLSARELPMNFTAAALERD